VEMTNNGMFCLADFVWHNSPLFVISVINWCRMPDLIRCVYILQPFFCEHLTYLFLHHSAARKHAEWIGWLLVQQFPSLSHKTLLQNCELLTRWRKPFRIRSTKTDRLSK